ncbi:hypothetical protein [Nocardia aurantiaca]|uniref:hypothetical protein n=1 Tax=Nocardia aurantiaca TaxID=2675850 RepID=UPI0018AB403F|nr:hypothetical protein [Nocardia aurantiaca]
MPLRSAAPAGGSEQSGYASGGDGGPAMLGQSALHLFRRGGHHRMGQTSDHPRIHDPCAHSDIEQIRIRSAGEFIDHVPE